MYDVRLSFY